MFLECCVISSGDTMRQGWMEILDCLIPCCYCHESPSNNVIEDLKVGAFVIATEQIIDDQLDILIRRIRNLRPGLLIIVVGSQLNFMDSGDIWIADTVEGIPVNSGDICNSIISFLCEHVETAAVNRTAKAIIARVKHEINNPLTAILGTAELMMETHGEHLDDKTKKAFKTIIEQVMRIKQFTVSLADLENFEIEEIHGTLMLKVPE